MVPKMRLDSDPHFCGNEALSTVWQGIQAARVSKMEIPKTERQRESESECKANASRPPNIMLATTYQFTIAYLAILLRKGRCQRFTLQMGLGWLSD